MAGPDPRIWDDILAHLRRNRPEICRRWFNDLRVTLLDRGTLHVEVRNPVELEYLRRECRNHFSAAAQAVTEMLVTVRFHGPDEHPLRSAGRPDGDRDHGLLRFAADAEADKRLGPLPNTHEPDDAHEGAWQRAKAGSPVPLADEPSVGDLPLHDDAVGTPVAEPTIDDDAAVNADDFANPSESGSLPVNTESDDGSGDVGSPARSQGSLDSSPGASDQIAPEGGTLSDDHPLRAREILERSWTQRPSGGSRGNGRSAGKSRAGDESTRIVIGSQAINPDYTFENFIEGPNNQLAHAAAIGVANHPGISYNPFFVHGGVGLGKTHLLQALCQQLLRDREGIRIYYVSCDDFTNQFMEAVRGGQMANFRNHFRGIDVLVVDDIHFLSGHERTQEEFFHTFNTLTQAQKQIVLSSDAPPNEIPALEDRLVSRFNSGLVTRIEQPGYETRMAILRQKAEIRALDLPREVAAFVARRIESNIRELEGVLNQLQVRSEVMNTPINEKMVREILSEKLPRKTTPIHIMTIIEHVAEWYKQKTSDLIARGRTPSIAWARQVAMYLAREMTSQSYKDIGSHFGGRDHTTVLHAIKQVGKRRQQDAAVNADIEQIEQRIQDAHQYGDF